MNVTKICPTCGHSHEYEACEECKGSGMVSSFMVPAGIGWDSYAIPGMKDTPHCSSVTIGWCLKCNGTGIKDGHVVVINSQLLAEIENQAMLARNLRLVQASEKYYTEYYAEQL